MLCLSLDDILVFQCEELPWLHGARFARKNIFSITLVVWCYSDFKMFYISLGILFLFSNAGNSPGFT